jgi:hypothetical protein
METIWSTLISQLESLRPEEKGDWTKITGLLNNKAICHLDPEFSLLTSL